VTITEEVIHGNYTFNLVQGQHWSVNDKDCTPDCSECCLEPTTGTAEFCIRRVDNPMPWKN
jgi:hypothetical protein